MAGATYSEKRTIDLEWVDPIRWRSTGADRARQDHSPAGRTLRGQIDGFQNCMA